MCTKIWLVLNFTDENTVEAVPSKWYIAESSECFWPPKTLGRNKIRDAIRKRLDPENDWKIYPCRILGEYSDFIVAEKKAAKAKETDYLTSSASESGHLLGKGNRKRFPRRRSSSTTSNSFNEGDNEDDNEYPDDPFSKDHPPIESLTPKSSQGSCPIFKKSNPAIDANNPNNMPSILNTMMNDINVKLDKHIAKSEEFQRQTMKYLHTIMIKQNSLADEILLIQQKHDFKQSNDSPSETCSQLTDILKLIPVINDETLEKLEFFLTEESNNNALAKQMSLLGGSTVKEITKNIMFNLIGNQLGALYSWEGAKKKKIFKNLKVANLILKAVRYNKRTESAAADEIIARIKVWLLRAKDRAIHQHEENN